MTKNQELDSEALAKLADEYDMLDRLAATLSAEDIDATVSRSVTLQLAGGASLADPSGQRMRGPIHMAIVSSTAANLSEFLSRVEDIAVDSTAHINGTGATYAGVIGSTSGGSLTPGPLLDDDIGYTIIERADQFGSKTSAALQQILDAGAYSFSKANYRQTVSASGSVLVTCPPVYNQFDLYEPISEQIQLTDEILSGCGVVLVNTPKQASPIEDDIEPLSVSVARSYLSAARDVDPTVTESAHAEMGDLCARAETTSWEDAPIGYSPARFEATVRDLCTAHAKTRLSETVDVIDVTRVSGLLEEIYLNLGIHGLIDVDEVSSEADTHQYQRGLHRILRLVDRDYDHGIPRDDIETILDVLDVDGADTEKIIESLRQKGELYQPVEGYYRTT